MASPAVISDLICFECDHCIGAIAFAPRLADPFRGCAGIFATEFLVAVKSIFIGDPVLKFDKRLTKHFDYASDDRVVALQCLAVGVHRDDKQVFSCSARCCRRHECRPS